MSDVNTAPAPTPAATISSSQVQVAQKRDVTVTFSEMNGDQLVVYLGLPGAVE